MIGYKKYNIPADSARVYDTPPNRHKHRWNKNEAGFTSYRGEIVGKCPNDVTLEEAQRLLLEAIAEPQDEYTDDVYPKRLYNVRKGIIYRAEGDGRSNKYHAFPADNIDLIDAEIVDELQRRAEATGHLSEFKEWKNEYGRRRS